MSHRDPPDPTEVNVDAAFGHCLRIVRNYLPNRIGQQEFAAVAMLAAGFMIATAIYSLENAILRQRRED